MPSHIFLALLKFSRKYIWKYFVLLIRVSNEIWLWSSYGKQFHQNNKDCFLLLSISWLPLLSKVLLISLPYALKLVLTEHAFQGGYSACYKEKKDLLTSDVPVIVLFTSDAPIKSIWDKSQKKFVSE